MIILSTRDKEKPYNMNKEIGLIRTKLINMGIYLINSLWHDDIWPISEMSITKLTNVCYRYIDVRYVTLASSKDSYVTDGLLCSWCIDSSATGMQWACNQGAVSIRKTVLPGMAIPMLKIRRPNGRLIFNMEIAIRR